MPERLLWRNERAADSALAALWASLFLLPLSAQLPEPVSGFFPFSALSYSFNRAPTFLARPRAPAIGQNFNGDAGVFLAAFANNCDIRDVDRRFLLNDSAFDVPLRIRPGVPFDHLNTLDDNLALFRYDDQNAPG